MSSLTTRLSPNSRSLLSLVFRGTNSVSPLRTIPGAQALDFLGPLGHVGMTAYFVSQRNATSPLRVLIPVDAPRA